MVAFDRCYAMAELKTEQGVKSIEYEEKQIENYQTELKIETDDEFKKRLKIEQNIQSGDI